MDGGAIIYADYLCHYRADIRQQLVGHVNPHHEEPVMLIATLAQSELLTTALGGN